MNIIGSTYINIRLTSVISLCYIIGKHYRSFHNDFVLIYIYGELHFKNIGSKIP